MRHVKALLVGTGVIISILFLLIILVFPLIEAYPWLLLVLIFVPLAWSLGIAILDAVENQE